MVMDDRKIRIFDLILKTYTIKYVRIKAKINPLVPDTMNPIKEISAHIYFLFLRKTIKQIEQKKVNVVVSEKTEKGLMVRLGIKILSEFTIDKSELIQSTSN